MESKNKKILSIISFLVVIILFILCNIRQGKELCYADDPPDPDPTPCCSEGYHQEPACTIIVEDPKTGDPVIKHLGEMTDVFISGPECVQWNEYVTAIYTANGGDDRDVCVNDTNSNDASEYDVPEEVVWSGVGEPDPNDPRKFRFSPPEPWDEEPCDSYTIEVEVDGTGDCNVGSEAVNDSVDVKVWKCVQKTDTVNRNVSVYFLYEGIGLRSCGWTGSSVYYDCNGTINTESQNVVLDWNTLPIPFVWGARHRFILNNNPQGWCSMSREMCGDVILPPNTSIVCSNTQNSYSYEQMQQGIEDEFEITGISYVGEGIICPGQIISGKSGSVPLTSSKCCD